MIELTDISFQYGGDEQNNSLSHIDLKVKKGEVLLLCGESGCGKTTITRMINGLIPQFYEGKVSGNVTVDRKKVMEQPICDTARIVGSVFQNPRSQFFNVDVNSELVFGCENMGWELKKIKQRRKQIVQEFGINNLTNRSIFELSGGEKQKIACASVAMIDTPVIVLDEPSASLDYDSIDELKNLLHMWKRKGKTIVIAEHRLYYLRDIADRIIFMKGGKIEKEFTGEQFYKLSVKEIKAMGLRCPSLSELFIEKKPAPAKESIEICDFVFSYKKASKQALHMEKLKIPRGKIIAIIGHNGAGKSTFARCLCGLEKRCRGKVGGMSGKERLKKCYMVMQDVGHQLFTESVLEEVQISMKDENDEIGAEKILENLDLDSLKDRHPQSLSGGQRQRVAIASAIASERDYLVFDEPTSGLDLRHMQEVSEMICGLSSQNNTIFLITHDLELIFSCCDHILHIENGEVADQYDLDELGEQKLKAFYGIVT